MKITNLIKYAAIGVLIIFALILTQKSCRLYDQNAILKGQIIVQETQIKKAEEATAKIKDAFDKVVIDKDKDISYWQGIANHNADGIAEGNVQIKDLKEQLAKLNPAEKDRIISVQKALIATLENNLTLAYGEIGAKDQLIKGLEGSLKTARFWGNATKVTTLAAVVGVAAVLVFK